MTNDYYMGVIDEIEKIRGNNNKNWMDILRLAFKHAPISAGKIMAEIYKHDSDISALAKKLTTSETVAEISLRKCGKSLEDCLLLFNWRNMPEIYQWFNNDRPVTVSEHLAYFDESINAHDVALFIIQHNGNPIGHVCLKERTPESAAISIYIAPEFSGQRFGTAAIKQACAAAAQSGLSMIVAEVRPENNASIKAFERAGFKKSQFGRILKFIWHSQP